MLPELLVIKIGGNVMDHAQVLDGLLRELATLRQPFILVHGGGKAATRIGERLGIAARMVDGRRITDRETLELVTMVYGGLLNRTLVAQMQARGINAIGLTGADANCLPAHKRQHPDIDYGFVGDLAVEHLKPEPFTQLLNVGLTPVLCALTHDGAGNLLNTNADTIASGVAICLSQVYRVRLLYCFDKPGVLLDVEDLTSLVEELSPGDYDRLRAEGRIFAGMLPKLENAFRTLEQGVEEVVLFQPADFLAVAFRTGRNFTRIRL
ncbi:MAG: acetylglutamate kinase [Bacteroidetes bacterium]|nr:acetylglutamate kinase [Bacteroidota bacterium]